MEIALERGGFFQRMFGAKRSVSPKPSEQPLVNPIDKTALSPQADTARGKANEFSVIFSRDMKERLEDNAHHVFKTARDITIDSARSMVRLSSTTRRRYEQEIQQEGHETLRELGLASEWTPPEGTTSVPRGHRRPSLAPTLISPRRNFGP